MIAVPTTVLKRVSEGVSLPHNQQERAGGFVRRTCRQLMSCFNLSKAQRPFDAHELTCRCAPKAMHAPSVDIQGIGALPHGAFEAVFPSGSVWTSEWAETPSRPAGWNTHGRDDAPAQWEREYRFIPGWQNRWFWNGSYEADVACRHNALFTHATLTQKGLPDIVWKEACMLY